MSTDIRPAPGEYAAFEDSYIARVPSGDIVAILAEQAEATAALLSTVPEDRANGSYAPGKWTIKEIVGHVCDTERIMAYRALRIARGDTTPLPGFEQDDYVPPGEFGRRTLASLIDEFEKVRAATVALFTGLPAEAWTRRGMAAENEHSVRALAYVIAGHELHHREILESRYLPHGWPPGPGGAAEAASGFPGR